MDRKKMVTIAILVLVSVIALAWAVSRMRRQDQPQWYQDELEERIDNVTLEPMSKPRGEWAHLEGPNGTWKNPDTGKYTIVTVTSCATCGEKIPAMVITEEMAKGGPHEAAKYLEQYKCPRCGKGAWSSQGGGTGPGAPPVSSTR